MKASVLTFLILIFSNGLFAQITNIVIDNTGSTSEPSIVVNVYNPQELVVGTNLNFCFNSNDGGNTWTRQTLTSTYGVWGDPCVITDNNGDFYFFHLSNPDVGNWIDRIVCQKSTDAGTTWNNGSFTGLNGTKDQDKEWASIDKNNNFIYLTWTEFDAYGSANSNDSSYIMFSKSEDEGGSWSEAMRINKTAGNCLDNDYTVEGAVPAVGVNGNVYVSWAGQRVDGSLAIMFDKSYDNGNTWLENDIDICDFIDGWTYDIPGINRANGLPVIMCDTSGSENHGAIYINWTDQRNGTEDTDVWIVKSMDEGSTWSEPFRVNDDASGKQQFFTWMTIDPITGFVYIIFYDRRNYTNNNTDVYMAISQDGGDSFENVKISETPFLPDAGIFFGDYTNITAYNNIVHPIWIRADGTSRSLITSVIDFNELGIEKTANDFYNMKSFPNPFSDENTLKYTVKKKELVSINIIDNAGKVIQLVIKDTIKTPGDYIVSFTPNKSIFTEGVYFWEIISGQKRFTKKIVYLK